MVPEKNKLFNCHFPECVFVILLFFIGGNVFTSCSSENPEPSSFDQLKSLSEKAKPAATASQQKNYNSTSNFDTLQLLFAGDIMGHGPQIESAQVIKDKQYNYYPCFEYIKPILQQADLAVANLELSLPGKPPYLGYPMFRSPDDLIPALRDAGFDLLLTANNHCNDAFRSGVQHAIHTLRENGFYQTGTFFNPEERDLFYPLMIYKKGFKLAFLNYTFSTNKLRPVPPTVINGIDNNQIKKDLRLAKELNPDIIIVTMHWGKEYRLEESKEQNELAQKIFSWGADLIVGSHPHVVQPIKTHHLMKEDGATKKVLVAYSLGNFISNQVKKNTEGGILLEVNILKEKVTKKVHIGEWSFLPIWRQQGTKKSPYRVLPVVEFESGSKLLNKRELQSLKRFATRIRNHLRQYGCPEKSGKMSHSN